MNLERYSLIEIREKLHIHNRALKFTEGRIEEMGKLIQQITHEKGDALAEPYRGMLAVLIVSFEEIEEKVQELTTKEIQLKNTRNI